MTQTKLTIENLAVDGSLEITARHWHSDAQTHTSPTLERHLCGAQTHASPARGSPPERHCVVLKLTPIRHKGGESPLRHRRRVTQSRWGAVDADVDALWADVTVLAGQLIWHDHRFHADIALTPETERLKLLCRLMLLRYRDCLFLNTCNKLL